MTIFIIVACIWIVCGVLAFGGYRAYDRVEYAVLPPAIFLPWFGGFLGPIGLAGAVLSAASEGAWLFKHGLKWRLPKDER